MAKPYIILALVEGGVHTVHATAEQWTILALAEGGVHTVPVTADHILCIFTSHVHTHIGSFDRK